MGQIVECTVGNEVVLLHMDSPSQADKAANPEMWRAETYTTKEPDTLAWIDTFTIPRKGKADDAAYKWINFVMQPEIVTMISDSSGAIAAVQGGVDLMPDEKRGAVQPAFTPEDIANLKFFANIPPGVEDMEGKTLERIKAATGG